MSNHNLDSSEREDSPRRSNRLISEKSPYLLQHAYNPVDWYPWGEEAFQKAKKTDKLIFLSIGYSTCHWCHVMAHESFEDPEVAELMNEAFISIKVDREERPDIDQIFMKVCLMATGSGGWPLTIIMTPDKKPVFAATYIPKGGRFGMGGLKELIPQIRTMWKEDREKMLQSADRMVAGLGRQEKKPAQALDVSALEKCYGGLSSTFDSQNGGFGVAPKFPTPHNLMFLLRYWQRSKDPYALQMVETTLQAMRMGGVYDQVGFGFHRYSTDAEWFVPHFEKMLYDQALLAMAYIEAYQATGKEEYASTAREVLEYVLRDMTSPEGGFYSAEDADSEGVEGKFYLWSAEELKRLLSTEEMGLLIRLYDVHQDGNFELGQNILRLRSSVYDAASTLNISLDSLRDRVEAIRRKLFSARQGRVRPLRDDKILADWNGLQIAALSKAARALNEQKYAEAASRAAKFVLEKMRTPDGRLLHRFKGEAGIRANLDDYAFTVWGLIEVYECTFEASYLREALLLNSDMLDHFWDGQHGGLFFTADDAEPLLVRQKEVYDGAVPSGNSVAMLNLLRLSHLTGRPELEEKASLLADSFSGQVASHPLGHSMFMCALDLALGPAYEVALVGTDGDEVLAEMLAALGSRFLPRASVVLVSDDMREMAEYARGLSMLNGRATAYVCSGYSCEAPTNEPQKMIDMLRGK
ncbi:MAG: thioredoxin domain-containing protein [Methanotrichaceae archaeon]|nr:thioredoxin domain-containing protein [Methanotrichaceae archaeon]